MKKQVQKATNPTPDPYAIYMDDSFLEPEVLGIPVKLNHLNK